VPRVTLTSNRLHASVFSMSWSDFRRFRSVVSQFIDRARYKAACLPRPRPTYFRLKLGIRCHYRATQKAIAPIAATANPMATHRRTRFRCRHSGLLTSQRSQ
jgi:hypothetical protein